MRCNLANILVHVASILSLETYNLISLILYNLRGNIFQLTHPHTSWPYMYVSHRSRSVYSIVQSYMIPQVLWNHVFMCYIVFQPNFVTFFII